MLQSLGLAPDVEAVYRGMLADPSGGVAELCVRIGLAETQVRDGLD
ncbi:hypothetical protein ACFXDJ_10355 [Streptomyces sp. NPDC059443]